MNRNYCSVKINVNKKIAFFLLNFVSFLNLPLDGTCTKTTIIYQELIVDLNLSGMAQ